MEERGERFLARAFESLAGAESELLSHRFNNVANRAYYACFQAAIAALQRAGIRAQGGNWGHDFVQSQFDGLLVNRRKLYPTELRGVLARNATLRLSADYKEEPVTETEAMRAVRRSREFLRMIQSEGTEHQ
jgi:uncharacterized protein (UPF0332 family)